jgi:hypothetical protein
VTHTTLQFVLRHWHSPTRETEKLIIVRVYLERDVGNMKTMADIRKVDLSSELSGFYNLMNGDYTLIWSLSMWVKRQGREAEHSTSSSAEVKNDGNIPPLPITCSWRGA